MSLAEAIIRVVTPHECLFCNSEGSLLCSDCWFRLGRQTKNQCYICRQTSSNCKTCKQCKKRSNINHVWIRSKYVFTPKNLVQALKYERKKEAYQIMAKAMLESIPKLNLKTVIVPVPTATSRKRQRSYDQAELLAKEIARLLNLPYQKLLIRIGQTRQVGSKRSQRLKQLNGSYLVPRNIRGMHILMVDDVLTTGSTLESAAKALKASGAKKIKAVVFARAL